MTPRYSTSLIQEAKKLGITLSEMDKYYNRGMLAWVDHKIPGTTPEQLGVAVVEEYVESEKKKQYTIRENLKSDEVVEKVGLKTVFEVSKTPKEKSIFSEEFVNNLPESEIVREWATSDVIQSSYIRRYGDKAETKLLEASRLFNKKPIQVEEYTPPAEPNHPNKPGTKRHSWDMSNWHEKKHKDAVNSGNQAAIDYHAKKVKEYTDTLNTSVFDRDRANAK